MGMLNDQQKQIALEIMEEFLSASANPDGLTPEEGGIAWDRERVKVINNELMPLLSEYLKGNISLSEFKSKVDSTNKSQSGLWGFKGIKGQMFFNMVVNVADKSEECDQEMKAAIIVPVNDVIATSRIKTFTSYVQSLGDNWIKAGNTGHSIPKVGSIPFFLSYFWQIQDRDNWPVYYTNSVQVITTLNLWQPSGDSAEDYLSYKRLHEELSNLFSQKSGKHFDLYKVEHVFWFKGGNPYMAIKDSEARQIPSRVEIPDLIIKKREEITLPDSYIPPIIAILPRIARHEDILSEAAKTSGTTLERAFEKYIDAAFTMLGYETKLLGMGKGRVPDGLALAHDESYAILWDAKVRSNGYSMGTDDRTIREYIITQSREFKKKRFLKNIYYVIISSSFLNDYDDTIRSIKMETDINEVILMESEALVAMVEAKLRSPLMVTVGPDGFQRLFSQSGILTYNSVKGFFN